MTAGLARQPLFAALTRPLWTIGREPATFPAINDSNASMVLAAATKLIGDHDAARVWFLNEPIADYRGKTASDLVAEGNAGAVLSLLEDLENGATG